MVDYLNNFKCSCVQRLMDKLVDLIWPELEDFV